MKPIPHDLAVKLLAHYKMALKEVKKAPDCMAKCVPLCVQHGLCFCARLMFNDSILYSILPLDIGYKTPRCCENDKEIYAALQFRIDYLKKFVE